MHCSVRTIKANIDDVLKEMIGDNGDNFAVDIYGHFVIPKLLSKKLEKEWGDSNKTD